MNKFAYKYVHFGTVPIKLSYSTSMVHYADVFCLYLTSAKFWMAFLGSKTVKTSKFAAIRHVILWTIVES